MLQIYGKDFMDIDELVVEKFGVKDMSSLPFKATKGSREEFAKFLDEIGYKTGAEIGVREGKYSLRLCRNIPGLKIKCIDPWSSFRGNSQARMDKYFRWAKSRLQPYDVEIIRKTSIDAAKDVSDGSLDFVYIDAMHEFDSVIMDIILWEPKVRNGGMVAGHDYAPASWCNGVIDAVQMYTKVHKIDKWYITSGNREEGGIPSFFWVKQ